MSTVTLSLDRLRPNPADMFRDLDDAEIAGLADSIRENGLIHPLVVRPLGDGYQIISGRQRHRAARLAGMDEVPCVVVDVDDARAEMMLIDANVQSRHLTTMEVARAVRRKKALAGIVSGRHTTGASSAQCAGEMGVSERQWRKIDALNDLIPPLQDLVDSGRLGVSAGEKLSRLPSKTQEELYEALGDGIADITGEEAGRLREENERGSQVLRLLQRELESTQTQLQETESRNGDKAALEERIRALRQQKTQLEYDIADREAGIKAIKERESGKGLALFKLVQGVAREAEAVRPEIETMLGEGVPDSLAHYFLMWGEMFRQLGERILEAASKTPCASKEVD